MSLFNEDCLNILPSFEANSIDFICADMPYGTTQCNWDSVIDLEALWPELLRITKPAAAIVLFAQTPFDKILGASNLELLRYEWVWEKTSATGFLNAKKMPMKSHENILVFYKKLPTYNPIKSIGHARKTSSRKGADSEVYGKAVKKTKYDSTERYPRSILTFPRDSFNFHPTQKPIALIEYLVRTYTNPGDKVIDFCMGSGTTGVACANSSRQFIGIEKNVEYFEFAAKRISEATQQQRLFV